MPLFMEILNLDIEVHTVADGKIYTKATGFEDLFFSMVVLSRGHEESKTKSIRIRATWEKKRRDAGIKPLTSVAPAWLKLSADRKTFIPIPEKVAVVQRIFEESASGIGAATIARRMNQQKIPSFRDGRAGWHAAYVNKILKGRAVLGDFLPHRGMDGRSVPSGDWVRDYFPRVVSDDLYYRSQDAMSKRGRGRDAGARGARVSNLFTSSILRCAYCDGRVHYVSRGARGKGFLLCDRARRGLGCEATRWRYSDLEASFLSFVRELDLESVIHSEDEARKRSILEDTIIALRGELTSIKTQQEKLFELVSLAGTELKSVANRLKDLETRHAAVEVELHEREQERARLEVVRDPGMEEIKGLVARIQDGTGGDEIYKLRSRLALRIRSLVTMILVAPAGHAPFIQKAIVGEPDALIDHEAYHRRYFGVGFRDGTVRVVIPDRDDPMRFDVQVVGSKGGTAGTVIDPDQEDPLKFDFS
jgi:hypothetical protein